MSVLFIYFQMLHFIVSIFGIYIFKNVSTFKIHISILFFHQGFVFQNVSSGHVDSLVSCFWPTGIVVCPPAIGEYLQPPPTVVASSHCRSPNTPHDNFSPVLLHLRAQWVVRRSRIHNSNTQVRDNHSVAPPCSHSPPSHAPVPKLMHFVTDAPEMGECSGPVTEISATVGSNITLPFKDATGDRVWRWERNNAELITCREGHPGFQGKTEDKGRFKVSCENHNLTIVGLQLGDQAQYSLCNSRHTCSCVNLSEYGSIFKMDLFQNVFIWSSDQFNTFWLPPLS